MSGQQLQQIESGACARESQADVLIRLCETQDAEFFHDQHKTAFVRVKTAAALVTMPVKSREFKIWLANLMWRQKEKAPGSEGLNSALNVLQAKALHEGREHQLYNRVAPCEGGFLIDMADKQWRAVKVTASGWEIIDNPPILFRRYSHMQPLPEPEAGGDPWKILDFMNVDKQDGDTCLTLICLCATYFIPLIPHPILVFYGIQGSGKSWACKTIRQVFDPSSIGVLSLPRNEKERVQQLNHHWIAFYDNITSVPGWVSDSLCRAATGGGFTKRELYSDDDDVVYNFKRCVGLNGINIAAQRGDLLDRVVLVGLQSIGNNKRATETAMQRLFERERPRILGGFLDVLAKAIQLYPETNPKGLFRMADFTRWGCAVSQALGKTAEDFMRAYEAKVKSQIEEAAHSSPVATVLLDFMEDCKGKSWEGTPTELYKTLLAIAKSLGISTRQKSWPKAPHVLVRQLNELAPSLEQLGWKFETTRDMNHRKVAIKSVTSVIASCDHENNGKTHDALHDASENSVIQASYRKHGKSPCHDAINAYDAIFPNIKGAEQTAEPEPLAGYFNCVVCRKMLPLSQISRKLGKPTCRRCAGEE